jgi:maltooligosyltrehalose trehalohydrolase
VREGRRHEFRKWPAFQDPDNRARIPDPNASTTLDASKLDWSAPQRPPHDGKLALTRRLLDLRRRQIVPRLKGIGERAGRVLFASTTGLGVEWRLADGSRLTLFANLSAGRSAMPDMGAASACGSRARTLYQTSDDSSEQLRAGFLAAWSVVFTLTGAPAAQDQ